MWTTTDTLILWGFWCLPALCICGAGVAYWLRNRSNAPAEARAARRLGPDVGHSDTEGKNE